jgi:kinetochore protein Nuf2
MFIDFFMGIPKETFTKNGGGGAFAAVERLEYRSLHEESTGIVRFFSAARSLMLAVGVTDFSMADLTAPDPKRTRRHLSAVINFAKFREERLDYYQADMEKADELAEARLTLDAEVRALAQRLTAAKSNSSRDRERVSEEERAVQSLQERLVAANKTQAALQTEIRRVKAADAETAKTSSDLKQRVAAAKAELSRLQAQVVSSPDKVRSMIAELEHAVAAERAAIRTGTENSLALQERLNSLQSVEKDVERCVETAEAVVAEAARADRLAGEVEGYASAVAAQRAALRELSDSLDRATYSLSATEEKTTRARAAHAARKNDVAAELAAARSAKLQGEAERSSASSLIAQRTATARQAKQRTAAAKEKHAIEVQAMREKLGVLHDSLLSYHGKVGSALAQAS